MKQTPKKTPAIPAIVQKAYRAALDVRNRAHAPYSKFKVGAALIVGKDEIITGCNVENASYGGTICAERTAILKAVSEGKKNFSQIVVVTDAKEPASPCGMCLQVMAEFLKPDAKVWIGDLKGVRYAHAFKDFLPYAFGPKQLSDARKTKTED